MGVGGYLAFLSNDSVDPNPLIDTNDRVIVSGVATGPGRSFEVVQATVESVSLMPTPPPCVLTILGPDPDFDGGRMRLDGQDCGGAGIPGHRVPSVCVGGFVDHDRSYLGKADATRHAAAGQRARETIASRIGDTGVVVSLDDPLDESLRGHDLAPDPQWTDCERLLELVERIRRAAEFTCEASRCVIDAAPGWTGGNAPALKSSSITFVDGDLDVSADFRGKGLLLVTGRIDLDSTSGWEGPILALGRGEVVRRGERAGGALRGAVVVANLAGTDGSLGTADDCRGGVLGFHRPRYDEHDAAIGEATYCTENIAAANPVVRYTSR